MMGYKHYMITMPSLTKQFFLQRPAILSSDSFLHWIHDKYFGDGGASKLVPEDDFHKVHASMNSLLREPFLSTATRETVRLVEERTPQLLTFSSNTAEQNQWEKVADVRVLDENSAEADLFSLTMDYVADIAGTVLMGHAFLGNSPGIIRDLWTLDNGFNALFTGIPGLTWKPKVARARLNTAINEWNNAVVAMLAGEDPGYKWGDLSDVSETMKLRIKALQAINAEESFFVASNLALYWGAMVNANKVIFWMLLQIISDLQLLVQVREEIAPFAYVTDKDDLKLKIDDLVKHCPLLKATFFETMRVYTAGTSYKKVHRDISLTESAVDAAIFGKKTPQTYNVAAGNFLAIAHATMQMDPRLWKDPGTFDPGRFLVPDEDAPGKKRADMLNLNAFGGGSTVCKGRYFAEREVLIFIAGILTVWDFELLATKDKGAPPKAPFERYYNGTGTANPKRAIRVRMTRRGC